MDLPYLLSITTVEDKHLLESNERFLLCGYDLKGLCYGMKGEDERRGWEWKRAVPPGEAEKKMEEGRIDIREREREAVTGRRGDGGGWGIR